MKIVFLGDSITEGCFDLFANQGGGFDIIKDITSGYPFLIESRLKSRFPDAGIEVINVGISGNTSKDGLLRIETDVIDKLPDIAVVCFGLNDVGQTSVDNYRKNMSEIFIKLRKNNIETIFMTPNMINTYIHPMTLDILYETAKNCAACQNNGTMDLFMQAGRESAAENGAALCDAYAIWKRLQGYGVDTTELLCNHINHPIRQMHRLFADLLEPCLTEKIQRLSDCL